MARAFRPETPEPSPAAAGETLASGLLEEAMAPLRRGEPCAVLDLGPARPATLAFFGGFPCRLGVADALAALAAADGDREAIAERLSGLLPESPRPWQLVLLWDALDYLEPAGLEALADALGPRLARGALLHAFVSTASAPVPDPPAVYEIRSESELRRRHQGGQRAPSRHTPWHIQRHLGGVSIERSRLHRDGRQEHLLRWG